MTAFFITVLSLLTVFLIFCIASSAYMFRFACARRSHVASVWDDDGQFDGSLRRYEGYENAVSACEALRQEAKSHGKRLSTTSHDGLRLSAMLIPPEEMSKTPVGILAMFHGYRSNPILDFAPFAQEARRRGFALLMADQRAHGGSEGKYITYGVHERRDVASWCKLLSETYEELPIVLCGVSMGAATVMLATEMSLPNNVCAVVADCGYTTPAAICAKVLKQDMKLPKFPMFYGATLIARFTAHFSFFEASAVKAAEKCRLPMLIIHGEADKFVPYEMGLEARDAAGDRCRFLSVPGAGHAKAYLCDPDGYMTAFLENVAEAGIKPNDN